MDDKTHTFTYALGDSARINVSGEYGEVIGRLEYQSGDDEYRIRYCASDGRATECWWSESAISIAE